jgi:hypothetical protein
MYTRNTTIVVVLCDAMEVLCFFKMKSGAAMLQVQTPIMSY